MSLEDECCLVLFFIKSYEIGVNRCKLKGKGEIKPKNFLPCLASHVRFWLGIEILCKLYDLPYVLVMCKLYD